MNRKFRTTPSERRFMNWDKAKKDRAVLPSKASEILRTAQSIDVSRLAERRLPFSDRVWKNTPRNIISSTKIVVAEKKKRAGRSNRVERKKVGAFSTP
jgi:hypothetical protein